MRRFNNIVQERQTPYRQNQTIMQGIQFFEYKNLLESLRKLEEAEINPSAEMPSQQVLEQEAKLKNIYVEYREAIDRVANCIRQFEEHKLQIRRFVKHHKQPGRSVRRSL